VREAQVTAPGQAGRWPVEYIKIKLEKRNAVAGDREGRWPELWLVSGATRVRQDCCSMLS
jgi:hypothetical protein